MELRSIEQLDLKDKKILLRLDLDVPIKNDTILDETKILMALPTIRHILAETHKIVICTHHTPGVGAKAKKPLSIKSIGYRLAHHLEKEIVFVENIPGEPIAEILDQIEPNRIVLLENLSFYEGEAQKDLKFAADLIRGLDYFINDAFSILDKNLASTCGIPTLLAKEKTAAGFIVKRELEIIQQLQQTPEAPFTVIFGGSRLEEKAGAILSLLNRCNHVIIGGAMAYTFLKYQGVAIGASLVEDEQMHLVKAIYENAESRCVEIHLPLDHICVAKFNKKSKGILVDDQNIPDGLVGLDIGPKTRSHFGEIISDSKTLFWSGAQGYYRWAEFEAGSIAIAEAVANSHGRTVCSGRDTLTIVNATEFRAKYSYVSTGDTSFLACIEGKVLPGMINLFK